MLQSWHSISALVAALLWQVPDMKMIKSTPCPLSRRVWDTASRYTYQISSLPLSIFPPFLACLSLDTPIKYHHSLFLFSLPFFPISLTPLSPSLSQSSLLNISLIGPPPNPPYLIYLTPNDLWAVIILISWWSVGLKHIKEDLGGIDGKWDKERCNVRWGGSDEMWYTHASSQIRILFTTSCVINTSLLSTLISALLLNWKLYEILGVWKVKGQAGYQPNISRPGLDKCDLDSRSVIPCRDVLNVYSVQYNHNTSSSIF